jgi:Ni/Co efflux regulator RcnB
MKSLLSCAALTALLAAPVAQAAPVLASEQAPDAAAAKAAAPAASAPAAFEKKVLEDDKVRIEESRVRGQTQAITVKSKLRGVKDYEIIMPPLGKDPSQDSGAAGKRTWHLFDF